MTVAVADGRSDAAEGPSEHVTGLGHPRRTQPRDALAKRVASKRVEVVEARHARLGHAVLEPEWELAQKPANRPCAGGHDDGADAVGDGITSEDEHGPIAARSSRPPHLASHHAGVALHPRSSSVSESSTSLRGCSS